MKKTYWKDLGRSVTGSWGRFLSIVLLMMLGSFALIGLKVTTPDMQRTASAYLKEHAVMDLAVMSDYGLSSDDQKELSQLKKAKVEYGYFTDVTVKGTQKATRVLSQTKDISTFELVVGRFPKSASEIVLSKNLQGQYKIGGQIDFSQAKNGLLKTSRFKVVGFANSSEILSTISLGNSTAGNGSLTSYAVVSPSAFDSQVPTIARIRYDELVHLNPFGNRYAKKLVHYQKQLDDLLADNGAKRLAQEKNNAQKQIDSAQKRVDSAKAKLTSQQAQAEQLPSDLRNQLNNHLQKAQIDIKNSEKQIQQAQASLQALREPTYSTYNRSTMIGGEGYQTYRSSTSSISSIGNLFPVVLYMVAALVTFTTMTRFVDEERTNAGIFKALGYDNKAVILKFVVYGLTASLFGTVLGVLAGHYGLSRIIAEIITSNMTLPATRYDFYWSYTLLALALAVLSAVLPAYLVARRELSEKPAQLLLPKPPVKGAKILLERVGFIWKRLSFTHKVTVRNIFRYKGRMLMTIFGVAGSVALLVAGLGIQSSLSKVVDQQFKTLMPYDMLVVTSSGSDVLEKSSLAGQVAGKQPIYYQSLSEEISGAVDKQSINFMASDSADFGDFVHLKDAKIGKKLTLSKDGVILSQKLAKLYRLKVGDEWRLTNKQGKKVTVKVAAISQMRVGHYLFMSDKLFKKDFAGSQQPNAYLLKLKDKSSQSVSKVASQLLARSDVTAVVQNASLIKTVRTVVKSLNGAMTMLIIVSVLLAVVILYNLTNINIAERIRELSTIKVLGFYDNEVTLYIYRETISLSLIGIVLGLLAGKFLHEVIMGMIGSNDILFGTEVSAYVYAVPILAIALILLALGCLVNYRLKTLDMLEALKSVD